MDLTAVVASELEEARRRSLAILDPLSEEWQLRQHSPLMSPLVWDLAHVANYEEIWLLRALGHDPVHPEYDEMYDAARQKRSTRSALDLLGPSEARLYASAVRSRALGALEGSRLGDLELGGFGDRDAMPMRPCDPTDAARLLEGAFVYGMVVQHEHQHDETMLATIQISEGACTLDQAPPPPGGRPITRSEVLVPGGPFVMGSDTEPWVYDNERPGHVVDVGPFWIDTVPVSNASFLEFVEDGGYEQRRWWEPAGWSWRVETGACSPQYWTQRDGTWMLRRFSREVALPLDEPVQHVCWYEADAFARWAGRRLPTEAEWEKAASWDPSGTKLRYPWGDAPPEAWNANVGQAHHGPAPLGAYPRGASPSGCEQMIGDVWEWTASDFRPFPGFSSFPYREYSEVFFGSDYKVLRGGSWATHPSVARSTFRNWDYPVRRQIFAGFRCARDAEPVGSTRRG